LSDPGWFWFFFFFLGRGDVFRCLPLLYQLAPPRTSLFFSHSRQPCEILFDLPPPPPPFQFFLLLLSGRPTLRHRPFRRRSILNSALTPRKRPFFFFVLFRTVLCQRFQLYADQSQIQVVSSDSPGSYPPYSTLFRRLRNFFPPIDLRVVVTFLLSHRPWPLVVVRTFSARAKFPFP